MGAVYFTGLIVATFTCDRSACGAAEDVNGYGKPDVHRVARSNGWLLTTRYVFCSKKCQDLARTERAAKRKKK